MSVKHALLALLYKCPMHGYEPGQIASTLIRLNEARLVDYEVEEIDDAPDRKVYFITEEGKQELQNWYLTPDIREYKLGDAFYVKLVLSLICGPVSPEQVLMAQRRELYQHLHEITEMRRQTPIHSQLPLLLLLESATMHLEADLRWIEMCEARLPELRNYAPPKPATKPRGRPRRNLVENEETPVSSLPEDIRRK
jgi:DNA-binding PadR family transcriptional regulator